MFPRFVEALRNGPSTENEFSRPYMNAADGVGATLTYSFMSSLPEQYAIIHGDPSKSFQQYSAKEKAAVSRALSIISSVINVKFIARSSADDANLAFGQFNMTGADGYARYGSYNKETNTAGSSDLWIRSSTLDLLSSGNSLPIHTILHEVGHALGLKHPFDGHPKLSPNDQHSSMMSYSYWGASTELGVLDVIALQSIYGPAKRKLGNTLHVFGQEKLIWDGGGTDTITAASAAKKVAISLQDGSWNYLGAKATSLVGAPDHKYAILQPDGSVTYIGTKGYSPTADGQIFLGYGTKIENLIGSRFGDTLTGNELNNGITAGSGNDVIKGGDGNDRLYGQKGSDVIVGGTGADRIYTGGDKDKVVYYSYGEFGELTNHDTIFDFSKYDKIDLRRFDADPTTDGLQKVTFLGNGHDDTMLSGSITGQFYFNVDSRELRFDANGDNIADYVLGVKGVAVMKASYFLV